MAFVETLEPRALLSGTISGITYNAAAAGPALQGIPGVRVYLDANNNRKLDKGEPNHRTGSHGAYQFTGLAAGTYHVRQVVPAGYTQSAPARGAGHTVKLAANQAKAHQDFGDTPKPATVLAYWGFDYASLAVGSESLDGTPTAQQLGNDVVPSGYGGYAIAWDRGVNDGGNALLVSFDPSGAANLSVTFDYRSTQTSPTGISYGPKYVTVEYRLNGAGAFQTLGGDYQPITADSGFHPLTQSLAAVPGISTASKVEVEVLPASGADKGTFSIDDFEVIGAK